MLIQDIKVVFQFESLLASKMDSLVSMRGGVPELAVLTTFSVAKDGKDGGSESDPNFIINVSKNITKHSYPSLGALVDIKNMLQFESPLAPKPA